MTRSERPQGTWELGLAEDVDLPGWVWLPEAFEPGERDAWVDEVVPLLQNLMGGDRSADTPEIRSLLEAGLDARAQSDSFTMYQVWPLQAPTAVMCHVNRFATDDLPALSSSDAVRLQPADARHIGPGVQVSSRVTVDDGADVPTELLALSFVFADESDGIMVNLEPTLAPLVSHTMVGLGLYLNALIVTRDDGTVFHSAPAAGLIADEEWPTDAENAS